MQTAEKVQVQHQSWRWLLARSAVAQAIAYALVAGILRDAEAAMVAVGSLVGIGLLRFRKGTLGALELGGLLAFAAYWMVPAAANNLAHSEGVFETAVPAVLSVIALTGAVAAALCLVELRRGPVAGARPAGIVATALLAVLIALAFAPIGQGATEGPADVSVTSKHVKFSSTELQAEAGEITVAFANEDLFWHTFTIRELGVDLRVPVRAERRITFVASAGTYEFVCTIPGHEQAGMKGTLTVR